ncbi:MAG: hypothetical protein GXP08_16530 [Gammaproteobacteria bacterium]|nr:hypothetical protein [Gammaproteobacteria bacterium]
MRLSFGAKPITFRNVFASFFLFFSHASLAVVIPVNLNDFFSDPTVTISVDGSSATLAEDSSVSTVILSNDPGLGDPEVIFAAAGTNLLFDFEFIEPLDNDNVFSVFVLDGDSGLSFGAGFEFLATDSDLGTVSFDLTGLVGELLGLQFELGANIGDEQLTSTVLVSNVRLETMDVEVPEPMLLLLFGLGLTIITAFVRRESNKKNN